MFLRLRQLCLVAEDLAPVVDDLCAVFGAPVCHRDPAVARFGLHNAMVPFGTSFVEVVSPLQGGTAAGRYLERRGGDGGYMVILDSDGLPRWRDHVAGIGVPIAAALALGDYEGMQLHPRDTGGALLEINHTRGNSSDPNGPYAPAGPHWQRAERGARVNGMAGAVLQSDEPERLARRWGEILQRPPSRDGDGWRLLLDNAHLRFVAATDGRGDGLAGIDVEAADAEAIIETAAARGCAVEAGSVILGGVRFGLRAPPAPR